MFQSLLSGFKINWTKWWVGIERVNLVLICKHYFKHELMETLDQFQQPHKNSHPQSRSINEEMLHSLWGWWDWITVNLSNLDRICDRIFVLHKLNFWIIAYVFCSIQEKILVNFFVESNSVFSSSMTKCSYICPSHSCNIQYISYNMQYCLIKSCFVCV